MPSNWSWILRTAKNGWKGLRGQTFWKVVAAAMTELAMSARLQGAVEIVATDGKFAERSGQVVQSGGGGFGGCKDVEHSHRMVDTQSAVAASYCRRKCDKNWSTLSTVVQLNLAERGSAVVEGSDRHNIFEAYSEGRFGSKKVEAKLAAEISLSKRPFLLQGW
eukprot:6211288-Pleurochrysis_carterae.AAC.2